MIIRFVTEVGLVSEVVTDIKIVAKAYHALVVLVDMPIVLRKNNLAQLGLGILKNGQETPALDGGRAFFASEFV